MKGQNQESKVFVENFDQKYLRSLKLSLSDDEQMKLAERMVHGDIEARNILFETNLRLIVPIAKKYSARSCHLSFMDLFQEGSIGLVQALSSYDIEKKSNVVPYACKYILGYILNVLKKQGYIIRPSEEFLRDRIQYQKITQDIERDHHDPMSYAKKLQEVNRSFAHVIKYESVIQEPLSLDLPIFLSDECDTLLFEVIPDLRNNTEHEILSFSMSELLQQILDDSNLSRLQREIIILRNWPIQDYSNSENQNHQIMTYKEIAKIYGVSHQYIANEEKRAIHKLKLDPSFDQFVNILDYPTEGLKRLQLYREEYQSNKKERDLRSSKRKMKLQSLLAFLNIDEDQYQYLYNRLTDRERNLLYLAYGEDPKNPVRSEEWKCEHIIEFYCVTVPIMKEILKRYPKDKQKSMKENFGQMMEVIQSTDFSPVLDVLSDEEAIVVRLSLEQFEIQQIALFLNLAEERVYEILQNALPLYREFMESIQKDTEKVKELQKVC